jgi:hypothetical protein
MATHNAAELEWAAAQLGAAAREAGAARSVADPRTVEVFDYDLHAAEPALGHAA